MPGVVYHFSLSLSLGIESLFTSSDSSSTLLERGLSENICPIHHKSLRGNVLSSCSPGARSSSERGEGGGVRRHLSKRTFQVLQAPIYQDKIIHYLIRWEMSPCGSVCVSDVRWCNEAVRQRLRKLGGETAPFG